MLLSVSDKIQSILKATGLKVATQNYEYTSSGITHQGQNVYAIIQAPRGDATEAIVLVAAWKTVEDELNLNGITLALTLARYFKRGWLPRSLWDVVWFANWMENRVVAVVEGYHLLVSAGQ